MTVIQTARGIHEVPEYRQQMITRAIKGYGGDVAYWEKAWAGEHHYWVQISTGIVYVLRTKHNKDAFLLPLRTEDRKDDRIKLQDGHRVEDDAVLICQCGNDRLQVWYPEAYETKARCPDCGRSDTIASG